ncbi:preprotein translocase subunit YajC [Acetohalobium arabaticum]|uniref:Preprotein translocase, YajC subunit n=1 Tax=Acetohalobium arabaticum (strain ATCC 49924 / DSM 5501 / Z-7288) TaxID=574087 RepID=D9QVI8_ACEAZ|nr:preprotein translocase subunit YajC [Acetohalobium arabaticum]ADL12247.1 preprotein translocase, YajC subunit [Acetohalobium arabaticum DSM 5501]
MNIVMSILPWVAIFGIFWFLFIRPQKKKQQEHEDMVDNLEVGDEIITIGGIKGKITKIDGDEFRLKISPEVEVEVIRNAVGRLAGDESEENNDE